MQEDSTPSTRFEEDAPLCACGCGQHVKRFQRSNGKPGATAGGFAKFLHNHHRRKNVDPEEKKRMQRQNYLNWRARHLLNPNPSPQHVYETDEQRKEAKRQTQLRLYERKRQVYSAYMQGRVCLDCGSSESLQWHHIDPKTKSFNIARMVPHVPLDALLIEIQKCELLCRKCHWKRHSSRAIKGGEI